MNKPTEKQNAVSTPCPPINAAHGADEPPREVWVVSSPTGPDYVASYRQAAMEHASECAGDFPENGPYRVCRYIAEPFAAIQSAAPIEREALEEDWNKLMDALQCDDTDSALAKIAALSAPAIPEGHQKALRAAVSAIYFNDSSVYESALYSVVRHLAPDMLNELETNPSETYRKATEFLAA
jgi:hypothetical protein